MGTHTYVHTHEHMHSNFPDKSDFRNPRCTQIAKISISLLLLWMFPAISNILLWSMMCTWPGIICSFNILGNSNSYSSNHNWAWHCLTLSSTAKCFHCTYTYYKSLPSSEEVHTMCTKLVEFASFSTICFSFRRTMSCSCKGMIGLG